MNERVMSNRAVVPLTLAVSLFLVLAGQVAATHTDFLVGRSSQTRSMVADLQTLSSVRPDLAGRQMMSGFFDNSYPLSVSQPRVVVAPDIQRPGVQVWLNPRPRLVNTGQGMVWTRLPSRINRGPLNSYQSYQGQVPYPGYRTSYQGYRSPSQGYRTPYQQGSYSSYPGYYRPPGLGDQIVEGFRWFFNKLASGFNNIREAVARAIEPQYPFVTRYIEVRANPRNVHIPVYRYRPRSIDLPGYSFANGYGNYAGYAGNTGYSGYGGNAGYQDPRRYGYSSVNGSYAGYQNPNRYGYSGYQNSQRYGYYGQYRYLRPEYDQRRGILGGTQRYINGYGQVPAFGRDTGYRFVPGVGLVPPGN